WVLLPVRCRFFTGKERRTHQIEERESPKRQTASVLRREERPRQRRVVPARPSAGIGNHVHRLVQRRESVVEELAVTRPHLRPSIEEGAPLNDDPRPPAGFPGHLARRLDRLFLRRRALLSCLRRVSLVRDGLLFRRNARLFPRDALRLRLGGAGLFL